MKKTVNVTIPSGKHTLRIDFVNWTGAANVKFSYTPRTSSTVDKVKPRTPTGTTVTYDTATGKARITWSKNKEMDLAGYRVYRRLKGSAYPAKPLATTTSTSYTDTRPPPARRTTTRSARSTRPATSPPAPPTRASPRRPHGSGGPHRAHRARRPQRNGARLERGAGRGRLPAVRENPATGSYTLVENSPAPRTRTPWATTKRRTPMSCAPSTRREPGPYSKPVTSDGIDRAAPAAPVNLHVTPGRTRVLLTWNAPEHPTLDELINDAYFTVLRSEGTRLGRTRCGSGAPRRARRSTPSGRSTRSSATTRAGSWTPPTPTVSSSPTGRATSPLPPAPSR
ncbi:hypothetical protein ACR6C2_20335 [Streptomyces sp. INA 01156]